MSDIEDKVKDIVCEQMGAARDKITPATSFVNDLGADSLDTVELVMEFEDEFHINIPDEDAEKIQTVGDAIKYITENSSPTGVYQINLYTISDRNQRRYHGSY